MAHSPDQREADPQARQPAGRRALGKLDKRSAANHGGGVIGILIGGLLKSLVAKLVLASVLAILAYFGVIARVAHLPSPFASQAAILKPHATLTTSAVMTKLTEIDQDHVATATYQVNVEITQSVGIIPCGVVCNKMHLQGTGTDDAILDLSALSQSNVEVNPDRSSVTVWIKPPAIGPAVLDPATCCAISSSHGVANSLTQGLHNNPNGYRPLYAAGEAQIHDQAVSDQKLLAAGEQSTRKALAQILATIGVKHVTVNFV
jgi:hypothetical protein